MIFEIDTVGDVYNALDADRLRQLGFEFVPAPVCDPAIPGIASLAVLVKTKGGRPIDFATIDELLSFAKEWSPTGDVIIDTQRPALIVFDDYVS